MSPCASPSIVVIWAPSCITASVRQAMYPLAVEQHGACAAGTLIAAFLGPGEIKSLTQNIKKRLPRIEIQCSNLTVDRETYAGHGVRPFPWKPTGC